jgi:chemotaxis protein MotB
MRRETSSPVPVMASPVAGAGMGQRWLVTFCDLMCLLLAFFVLLFSMQKPDLNAWEAVRRGLNRDSRPAVEKEAEAPKADYATLKLPEAPGLGIGYLGQLLSAHMAADPLLSQAVITRQSDRIVISLPSDLLFTPGSAAMSEDGRQALRTFANGLAQIRNEIEVVGHSDPTPVAGGRYVNNWDLSLDRALSAARALYAAGYPRSITVLGQGDAKDTGQLAASLPEAEQWALGRRVDIIVREFADQ